MRNTSRFSKRIMRANSISSRRNSEEEEEEEEMMRRSE